MTQPARSNQATDLMGCLSHQRRHVLDAARELIDGQTWLILT
jgi:hypothetical protein